MQAEATQLRRTQNVATQRVKWSVAAGSLLIGLLLPLSPDELEAQKRARTASEKDSIAALNRAVQSLRQYTWQLQLLAEMGARNLRNKSESVTGTCEIQVADYCYGPRNGQLAYGGFGTRPASGRFGPRLFAATYMKRYNWAYGRYRDSLLKVNKVIPGDRWVLGELLRLPLERQNYGQALDHLRNCLADDWYCNALRGYMLQISGALPRADSVWNNVLALMPPVERCAWLDPSWVSTDAKIAKRIMDMSCAERERVAHRVWWLSDPLLSREGNERRAEHLSRNVELLLQLGYSQASSMTPAMVMRSAKPPADSGVLYALRPEVQLRYAPWSLTMQWGYDELVMRLGAPRYFAGSDDGTVAQYPPERTSFVPNGEVFLDHLKAKGDDWYINNPGAFEFMNGWFPRVSDIPFQLAWFRRGDAARIVAATSIGSDSALMKLKPDATLVLQRDFDQPQFRFKGSGEQTYRFDFSAGTDSTLASIELLARNGASGRARFATGPQVMPAQRLSLSDLLLVRASAILPATLDQAVGAAHGSTSVFEEAVVGVFWEMYGAESTDSMDIELVAASVRKPSLGGFLRRVVGSSAPDSMVIRWAEPATNRGPVEPRSVNVVLTGLPPGRYELSIAVSVPGLSKVVTRREIDIVKR